MSNFWRRFFIALIIILIVAIGITRVKIIRAEMLLNEYKSSEQNYDFIPFFTDKDIIYA